MTPNQYQQFALKTEKTPEFKFKGAMVEVFHGAVGAAINVGTLQDIIKKHVIYGKPFNAEHFGNVASAVTEAVYDLPNLEDPNLGDGREIALDMTTSRVVHGMVGVVTEAGELQDMVYRSIVNSTPLDRLNLKEELGDILWYVALVADAGGFTLEEVMKRNIEKLKARYGDKFTEEAALNRDLTKEKSALNGTYYIDVGSVDPSELVEFAKTLKKHLGPDPIDVTRTIDERRIRVEHPSDKIDRLLTELIDV